MIGEEIGSWVLESPLGRGGMGEVFLARHKSLGTRAAVKVLTVTADEPRFHERFSLEARSQARLSHPNIARVLDHVHKDGRWFLVIEYMERGTLRDVLRETPGPVAVAQTLAWSRQALRGLEYAHQQGIVHRDVKPGNILLNDRGEAAVTDFGLVKVLGAANTRLTQTGMAIGTPAYMSPEQLNGDAGLDHRTDVYSMGVVVYELLTGRVPFPMESASEVVRILVHEPPPLEEINPDLPPELSELVMRALAKIPADRYQDCGEFARAIEAFELAAGAESPPARPAEPAVVIPPPPPPPAAGPAAPPAEPTAVLMPEAQLTPPPSPSPGRPTAWIAAGIAALALGALALAAGAAYYLWPDHRADDAETSRSSASVGEIRRSQGTGDEAAPSESDGAGVSESPDSPESPSDPRPGSDPTSLPAALPAAGPAGPELPEYPTEPAAPRRSVEPEPSPAPPLAEPRPPLPEPRPSPPPPRRVALPPDPDVAVIALGDPLFARAFESEIEDRLLGLGLRVGDENNSAAVADALRRWGDEVAVPELLPLLGDAGFQVVVLAWIEYLGSRDLYYLGRTSQAHQARVRVNAYLVPADGALGPGWEEPVEYTELNAVRKAETLMFETTPDLADAIHRGWRAFRRDYED